MKWFRTERVGFKTAVQKAAFEDDKVCLSHLQVHKCDFRLLHLSISILSLLPVLLLFFSFQQRFSLPILQRLSKKNHPSPPRCPSQSESGFRPYSHQPTNISKIYSSRNLAKIYTRVMLIGGLSVSGRRMILLL